MLNKTIPMTLMLMSSTACVSTMPTAFGESTEVLAPRQVSLTAMGGGGAVVGTCNGCSGSVGAVGGQARIRYGIDGKQEIGVSGFGMAAFSSQGGSGSSIGGGGGEVSYKIAPMKQLAFIAGAGVIDVNSTAGVGGDLGVLVAPYRTDTVNVYTGARAALVGYPQNSGAWAESITVPIGCSIALGEITHIILEGGLLVAWEQFNGSSSLSSNAIVGGYGTIGFQFTFGGDH